MLKLALLGLGVVGQELVSILLKHADQFDLKKILVKDLNKPRKINLSDLSNILITTEFDQIINDQEIDVIIELMGGSQPALNYILAALDRKKIVITANKEVLALHGDKIFESVFRNNTPIAFEASVCAGIPIIRSIISSFQHININRFIGIFNGTCNYILSNMNQYNMDYYKALEQAQTRGYAETNPILDISGLDSAYKSNVLSSLCFRQNLTKTLNIKNFKNIFYQGIENITHLDIHNANRLGYIIKAIAYGVKLNDYLYIATFPALINKNNIISDVNDINNIFQVDSELLGVSTFIGAGAGGTVTAASVYADLNNVLDNKYLDINYYSNFNNVFTYRNIEDIEFKFYVSTKINKMVNIEDKALQNKIKVIADGLKIKIIVFTSAKDIASKGNDYIIFLTDDILNSNILELCSVLMQQDYIEDFKAIRVIDDF